MNARVILSLLCLPGLCLETSAFADNANLSERIARLESQLRIVTSELASLKVVRSPEAPTVRCVVRFLLPDPGYNPNDPTGKVVTYSGIGRSETEAAYGAEHVCLERHDFDNGCVSFDLDRVCRSEK